MPKVNASDISLIENAAEILHLYDGAGENAMTGVEVELGFFDPKSPDLTPMTRNQNKIVKQRGNTACGIDCINSEPSADMLEIASIPEGPHALQAIMDSTNQKIGHLVRTAATIGLKRSYFQEQPQASAKLLQDQVVDVDRYQAFFAPPRADMQGIADYFFVCKSNQVSVSYRDPDHLLKNIRRLYFLAPFLFMLTDNSTGFDQGKPFTGHSGMMHRAALEGRGLVPPYVYTAQTGADYINAHIDHVMNNPMFVYYDHDGKIIKLPSGTWTSFNQLREDGLNTAVNYFFSETVLWPDVKIAALRDSQGNVHGHRYEARMFGVGIHQHQTALLITSALAFNEDFAAKTDALLQEFGFCPQSPEDCRAFLEAAYANARNHDGKFMDIAYGKKPMIEFAKKFADLLERAYTGSNLENAIAPVLTICRSGLTDAKVNRALFPTLEDILKFQKSYDPAIFDDPTLCAAMIFAKELKNKTQTAA